MAKPSIIRPAGEVVHAFVGIYGDPGIGKTRLIWSSPGSCLIIRPPVEHNASARPEDRSRIEEAVITTYNELLEVQVYLRDDPAAKYNWVWLDNAQGVFDTCLDDLWDTVLIEKPARERYGLDQGEYGIVMERLQRWVRHTVGADRFNFGYTSHSEPLASPDLDEDGDPVVKLMPYIQGKGMATKFAGYMNVVAYMTKATIKNRGEVRVLRTESSPGYYAKDQFDAFGGRVIDPTVPKLETLISKARGAKPAQKRTVRRVVRKKGAK